MAPVSEKVISTSMRVWTAWTNQCSAAGFNFPSKPSHHNSCPRSQCRDQPSKPKQVPSLSLMPCSQLKAALPHGCTQHLSPTTACAASCQEPDLQLTAQLTALQMALGFHLQDSQQMRFQAPFVSRCSMLLLMVRVEDPYPCHLAMCLLN